MTGEDLLLCGAAITAFSGLPGIVLRWFSRGDFVSSLGQWLAAFLAVGGCLCGLAGVGLYWTAGVSHEAVLPSPIEGADFVISLDPISSVFVLPAFAICLLGSIYGLGYWPASRYESAVKLRFFYGTLAASLSLLFAARSSMAFMFAWEGMALSAFFLVSTEDKDEEVRQAGWLYLATSHVATLLLFVLFAMMQAVSGTSRFVPLEAASPAMANAIFLIALVGFGIKAGIMPLHFWLPSAHAMAPSHVSALMSGVLIKTGVYGLVRILALLPHPPTWWGGLLIAMGAISGVLGMAFALGQRDIKRLLAYSSIENIGIIFIGLGLGTLGRSLKQPDWVFLGLGGALWHVWNHGLFKGLLFFTAGSVIHGTHTREIDLMGGLSKRMPLTALAFLIGALSACGLPPLNGFVGEFVLYTGLMQTLGLNGSPGWAAASIAAPALALIGALAGACFLSAYGATFLGTPRTASAREAHEAPVWMIVPLFVLSGGCLYLGLFPHTVVGVLDTAAIGWLADPDFDGVNSISRLAPLDEVARLAWILVGAIGVAWGWLYWRISAGEVEMTETWGCGYAAPTPRMQYTSSSLAEILSKLFGTVVRPTVNRPRVEGLFPKPTSFSSELPDSVLESAVGPSARGFAWFSRALRVLQQGSLHAYLLYIFLAVVLLLLWPQGAP